MQKHKNRIVSLIDTTRYSDDDSKIVINVSNSDLIIDGGDAKLSRIVPSDTRLRLNGRKVQLLDRPAPKKRISSATVNSHGDGTMVTAATTASYSGCGHSQSSSLFTHEIDDDDDDDDDDEVCIRSCSDSDCLDNETTSISTYDIVSDPMRSEGCDALRRSADFALLGKAAKPVLLSSKYAKYRTSVDLRTIPPNNHFAMTTISSQPTRVVRKDLEGDFLLLPEDEPVMMSNDDAGGNNNFSYMNMFGGGKKKSTYNPKDENQKFMYVSTIFSATGDTKQKKSGRGGGTSGGVGVAHDVGYDDHFLLEDDDNSTSNHTRDSSLFDESFTSYTSVHLLPRTYPHQRYWNGNAQQQQTKLDSDTSSPLLISHEIPSSRNFLERRTSLGSTSSRSRRRGRSAASLSFISERVNLDEADSNIEFDSYQEACDQFGHTSFSTRNISAINEMDESNDDCVTCNYDYLKFISTHFSGEINLLLDSYTASDPVLAQRHDNNDNETIGNNYNDPSIAITFPHDQDMVLEDNFLHGTITESASSHREQTDDNQDRATAPFVDTIDHHDNLIGDHSLPNTEIIQSFLVPVNNDSTESQSLSLVPSILEPAFNEPRVDNEIAINPDMGVSVDSTYEELHAVPGVVNVEPLVVSDDDLSPVPTQETVTMHPSLRSEMMRRSFWKSQQQEGSANSLGSVPMFDHPERLPNFMLNGMASIDCNDSYLDSSRQSIMSDYSRRSLSLSDNVSLNLDSSRHSLQSEPSQRFEPINEGSASVFTSDSSIKRHSPYDSIRTNGFSSSLSRMGISQRYSQRFGLVEPIAEDPLEESRLSLANNDSGAKMFDSSTKLTDPLFDHDDCAIINNYNYSGLSVLDKEEAIMIPEESPTTLAESGETGESIYNSTQLHESSDRNTLDDTSDKSLDLISRTYPFAQYWDSSEPLPDPPTNSSSVTAVETEESSDATSRTTERSANMVSKIPFEDSIAFTVTRGTLDNLGRVQEASLQTAKKDDQTLQSVSFTSVIDSKAQGCHASMQKDYEPFSVKESHSCGQSISTDDFSSVSGKENPPLVEKRMISRDNAMDKHTMLFSEAPDLEALDDENADFMFDSATLAIQDDDISIGSKQSVFFTLRTYPYAKFWESTGNIPPLQSCAEVDVASTSTGLDMVDSHDAKKIEITQLSPLLTDATESKDCNEESASGTEMHESQLVIEAYHEFFMDTLRRKLRAEKKDSDEDDTHGKSLEEKTSDNVQNKHPSSTSLYGAIEYDGFFDEDMESSSRMSTGENDRDEESNDDLSDMTDSVMASAVETHRLNFFGDVQASPREVGMIKNLAMERLAVEETRMHPPEPFFEEQLWVENASYSNPATIASSLGIKDGFGPFFSSRSRNNGRVDAVNERRGQKADPSGRKIVSSNANAPLHRPYNKRRNSTGSVSSTSDPTMSPSSIDPRLLNFVPIGTSKLQLPHLDNVILDDDNIPVSTNTSSSLSRKYVPPRPLGEPLSR